MEFCSSCKVLKISLPGFLTQPGTDNNTHYRDPIATLGTLSTIQKQYKTCPLCRVIFAAFRSGLMYRVASIADLESVALFAKWICPLGSAREKRLQTPSLCILVLAESPHFTAESYKLTIRAVSTLLPSQPHFGRISGTPFLDFDETKRWLRHCECRHTVCNAFQTREHPTEHFYVIDTRLRCIVKPPEGSRYLALSYVWGGVPQYKLTEDNMDKLSTNFSLRTEHLAPTIRDAMVLTGKLSERYLWVDTLCIVQDSRSVRQQTLQNMDRIYAQSLLTVVAGKCSSANDPLLGVTKERAWIPWYAKISPTLSISAHFDFKDLLEHATYSQRAWTFQEYQLANRSLVFAPDGQVYFSCREAVFSEGVNQSAELSTDVAMLQGAESVRLRPDSSDPWKAYRRAVEEYSKRNLTEESDALDAFTGILRTLCGTRCIEGLPAICLDRAILWQPRGRVKRRTAFSSWSWVGWGGQVHWVENREQLPVTLETWIVWYSCSAANCDSPAFLVDGPPWIHGAVPVKGLHAELFADGQRNHAPTPALLPDQLRVSGRQQRDYRFLQFWTFSTQLEIALDTYAVTRNYSFEAESTGSGLRRFLVRNNAAQSCGWVMLDESWISSVVNGSKKMQEFILLSEVDSHDWQFEGRAFNVMMIGWDYGIAVRTGLGQVLKAGLERLRPVWKEIVLG